MNSIINHLGTVNPQQHELTYKDYTFTKTYTSSFESDTFVQNIDVNSVYAELVSATCTNTVVLYASYANRIFLHGYTAASPSYPQVGVTYSFMTGTVYPVTVTFVIRVYFHDGVLCVTSADTSYYVYRHVAYTIGTLRDSDFTRV